MTDKTRPWELIREARVSAAILSAARDEMTEHPILSRLLDAAADQLDGLDGASDDDLYTAARAALRGRFDAALGAAS